MEKFIVSIDQNLLSFRSASASLPDGSE